MIPSPSPRLVEAITRAMADAQDQRAAMRRVPAGVVMRRLRMQAMDVAFSPLAYDQLLALALADLADGDLEDTARGRLVALQRPVSDIERLRIRHEVAMLPAQVDEFDLRAVVSIELERGGQTVGRRATPLATWLREAAALQAELWDHPALPADPAMRAAMQGLAPRLIAHGRWLRSSEVTLQCSPRPSGLLGLLNLKSR